MTTADPADAHRSTDVDPSTDVEHSTDADHSTGADATSPLRGHRVGRISQLWRYPVKSMGGQRLDEVEVSFNGLAGDRRWAFVRPGTAGNGFPWFTIRQRPDLARYQPSFQEPERPDHSRALVRTPSGAEFDVVDPALAAELGDGVRLIKQDRGIYDWLPLSLITIQTIAGLGALTGRELEVQRFRPNLVVDSLTGEAFDEDAWVGRTLRIGTLLMRVDERDPRCVIISTDPVTGVRDSSILRTVSTERGGDLGVYGSIVRPGRVAVGDDVVLLPGLQSSSAW
jgi:uncharacterized protein